MINFGLLLITGFTSAFNCVALQLGLLAGTLAEEKEGQNRFRPTLVFLTFKLLAYMVVGFFLGLVGESLSLSEEVSGVIELIAGFFIIASALNVLGVHPIFRYFVLQPPRFLTRLVRNQAQKKSLIASALLGIMMVLIPCGTTVAVEALAVTTKNPLLGMMIMLVFTLGTTPVFLAYGYISTILNEIFKKRFAAVEGLLVLVLGIFSLLTTLSEMGVIKL